MNSLRWALEILPEWLQEKLKKIRGKGGDVI